MFNFCLRSTRTVFTLLSVGLFTAALGAASTPSTNLNPTPSNSIAKGSSPNLPEESLPLRHLQVSFQQLGANQPLELRGTQDSVRVRVGVRLDEVVESAQLHLDFAMSPALLTNLSHLKILFNDELLQTVTLDKNKLGSPQSVDLKINPALFTDYNQIRFDLIGHYTLECESPQHSSLWASISNQSYLRLTLRPLPLANDLGLLPAPFFDTRDNRLLKLPFVFSSQPSLGVLRAAGSVAGWIGMLAAYRGASFPVIKNQLPTQHAVVLASNFQRPDFLKDLPKVQKPTLAIMAHPSLPGIKLLLVLGQDDAQVQLAADTLALGNAALSGEQMQVGALQYPGRRAAYDAPLWINTERVVQLGELVKNPGDLQLRGIKLYEPINISTRMAPDLFTWNASGVPLNLVYRHTPPQSAIDGALNVRINDQFVRSFPINAKSNDSGIKNTILLPLFDDSSIQAKSGLRIPAFLIGGDNQLQFSFNIPGVDSGRCSSVQAVEMFAAIDPQSTIDLTGFPHYVAMPNLAAFANSGFPFTKYADLAETSIVLSDPANPAEIELYLTILGRMAASTSIPATRFKLLLTSNVQNAADTDILLIGKPGSGATNLWNQNLPALIEAGKRSVRPLGKTLESFMGMFNLDIEYQVPTPQGRSLLEGSGALAAVAGMESPLTPGRSVIVFQASDNNSLKLIGNVLNDPGKLRNIRGDLSFVRDQTVESFRVNPVFYSGHLPWWQLLWFRVHTHPILVAAFGLGGGLLLAFLAYVALRTAARQRLQPHHQS